MMKLVLLILIWLILPTTKANTTFSPESYYLGIENDSKVNCLSYALNQKREIKTVADSWFKILPKLALIDLVEQLKKIFRDPKVARIVSQRTPLDIPSPAMYLSHDCQNEESCLVDYHFMRQDADGFCSHKMGRKKPVNTDADGKKIANPLKSNLRYEIDPDEPGFLYTDYQFIGFFEVKTSIEFLNSSI